MNALVNSYAITHSNPVKMMHTGTISLSFQKLLVQQEKDMERTIQIQMEEVRQLQTTQRKEREQLEKNNQADKKKLELKHQKNADIVRQEEEKRHSQFEKEKQVMEQKLEKKQKEDLNKLMKQHERIRDKQDKEVKQFEKEEQKKLEKQIEIDYSKHKKAVAETKSFLKSNKTSEDEIKKRISAENQAFQNRSEQQKLKNQQEIEVSILNQSMANERTIQLEVISHREKRLIEKTEMQQELLQMQHKLEEDDLRAVQRIEEELFAEEKAWEIECRRRNQLQEKEFVVQQEKLTVAQQMKALDIDLRYSAKVWRKQKEMNEQDFKQAIKKQELEMKNASKEEIKRVLLEKKFQFDQSQAKIEKEMNQKQEEERMQLQKTIEENHARLYEKIKQRHLLEKEDHLRQLEEKKKVFDEQWKMRWQQLEDRFKTLQIQLEEEKQQKVRKLKSKGDLELLELQHSLQKELYKLNTKHKIEATK